MCAVHMCNLAAPNCLAWCPPIHPMYEAKVCNGVECVATCLVLLFIWHAATETLDSSQSTHFGTQAAQSAQAERVNTHAK